MCVPIPYCCVCYCLTAEQAPSVTSATPAAVAEEQTENPHAEHGLTDSVQVSSLFRDTIRPNIRLL